MYSSSYLVREAETAADRGITMLTGWGPDLGQFLRCCFNPDCKVALFPRRGKLELKGWKPVHLLP